jgi:hypothetical protein
LSGYAAPLFTLISGAGAYLLYQKLISNSVEWFLALVAKDRNPGSKLRARSV